MTRHLWEHKLGLSCTQGRPDQMNQAHRHHDLEVNIVIEGRLTYLFGGRRATLEAGSAAMFWAAIPHQLLTASADAYVRWLNLPWTVVSSWGLDRTALGRSLRGWPLVVPATPGVEHFELWAAEVAGNDTELRSVALLEIQAYLRRLLHTAEAAPSPVVDAGQDNAAELASAMARFVARHFAERVSVTDVAGTVHLNPRYAMTVFRRVTGLTIGGYLEQCRVAEAQRLLLTTDVTTAEVAHASGFGSISRLYASFTPVCGHPPAAYRRLHRLS